MVAVPFSSNSAVNSLPFTLMVTLPVPFTTFTVTRPFEPIQIESATTVISTLGMLFSTTLSSTIGLMLTAASPFNTLAIK